MRTWSIQATVGVFLAALVLVAACTSPPPPGGGADDGLGGTWFLTRAAGSEGFFGTDGLMTLTFDGANAGSARFLGVRAASGVTECGTYVFAWFDGSLELRSPRLEDWTFDVAQVDEGELLLTSGDEALVMTRIAGGGPVVDCASAAASEVAALPFRPGTWSRLSAFGDTLYLNRGSSTNPIVGYSLTAGALGPERVYTQSSGAGVDRWVIAARSDGLFFGHCACGNSQRVGAFDLDADAFIAGIDTNTDLGRFISVRFGYLGTDGLVVGGVALDAAATNRLLTLDPDTLSLASFRDVLQGTAVQDLVLHDGRTVALVSVNGPALVEIGPTGTASTTYLLPALAGMDAFGLASTGAGLYVAALDRSVDTTYLFEVELD